MAAVRARLLDRELELVRPARDHVQLREERRDIERVDDVRRVQADQDRLVHRHDHLGPFLAGAGEGETAIGVFERPLPLERGDVDRDAGFVRPGLHGVQDVHGDDEHRGDDQGRDGRPYQLEAIVAVGLAQACPGSPTPEAEDHEEQQPFDHHEDDDGDHKDCPVEPGGLRALNPRRCRPGRSWGRRHRRWGVRSAGRRKRRTPTSPRPRPAAPASRPIRRSETRKRTNVPPVKRRDGSGTGI